MNWLQILGQVPKGYSDQQDANVSRGLKQQEFDTNNRQGPLKDEYLRAQIAHLRRPPQSQLDSNSNNAALDQLIKFATASGQGSPMPQPPQQGGGPSPFQGASSPQPGPSPAGPGQGLSLPPGFQASPGGGGGMPAMPLPQSAGGIGMPGQQSQPQPGPIAGSGPVPQPPQPPQPGGGQPQQGGNDMMAQIAKAAQGIPDPRVRGAFVQMAMERAEKQQKEARDRAHDALAERKQDEMDDYRRQNLGWQREKSDATLANTRRNTDVSTYGRASTRSQGEEAIQKYGTPPAAAEKVSNPFKGVPKKDALEAAAQAEQFFAEKRKAGEEFTTSSGRKFRYFVEDDEPHAEPVE